MFRFAPEHHIRLMTLHQATLAARSDMKTPEEERARFVDWKNAEANNPKRRKKEQPLLPKCAECAKWYERA